LAAGVHGVAGSRAERLDRRDVDDAAAHTARDHLGRHQAHPIQGRQQVLLERRLPLGLAGLQERGAADIAADVVDQDVYGAQRRQGLVDQLPEAGELPAIGLDAERPAPQRADLIGGLARAVAVEVDRGDVRAPARQTQRDALADPLPGAGHQRHAIGQRCRWQLHLLLLPRLPVQRPVADLA
jgi:hypothetical protein